MDLRTLSFVSLAAAALGLLSWGGYRVHAADKAALLELEERLDRLAQATAEPSQVRDEAHSIAALEDALEGLGARLSRLEETSQRQPVPAEGAQAPTPDRDDPPPSVEGTADLGERAEFDLLLAQLIDGGWDFSSSRDDFERFLELARNSEWLDERIAELEAQVEINPGDLEGRMELADTYVGKLMTVAGPEQGLWGGRAEEQWRTVAELDDGHWGAHSSLGTNYSYYPEVMGKTADAILHLERAREIQRDTSPEPEHVQTYLFLARMYERDGKMDEARDALLEGLQHHPGNQELETALGRLGG